LERILLRNSNRQLEKSKILREFVFVQSNGKQYKKDTVSKSLKKVIKQAGLPVF